MSQQATMIIADNSEWMRNGDYQPSRLDAQKEAIQMIAGAKLQQNPENTVGLITMAGRAPEVLVTLSPDVGKILTAVHDLKIGGESHIMEALRIAQLGLLHRRLKHQQQRIILFVGSPLGPEEKDLVRLAKQLKKNSIAVDIVNFGEVVENRDRLEKFIATIEKDGNSHLVHVPPGPHLLSDALVGSAVIYGEGASVSSGGGGGGGVASAGGAGTMDVGGGFGGDMDADEMMRMAIQMSLEEERQRQEREAREAGEGGESGDTGAASEAGASGGDAGGDGAGGDAAEGDELAMVLEEDDEDDLDAELLAAIEMSKQTALEDQSKAEGEASEGGAESAPAESDTPSAMDVEDEFDDEAAMLEAAMRMSLLEAEQKGAEEPQSSDTMDTTDAAAEAAAKSAADSSNAISEAIKDDAYVESIFEGLPGVDPSDPTIQGVLSMLKGEGDEKAEDKKKDSDKKQ